MTTIYRHILATYWRYAREYRAYFFLTLGSYGTAYALMAVGKPYVLKELIDALAGDPGKNISILLGAFVGLVAVHELLFSIADFSITRFETDLMARLRTVSLKHILRQSPQFFANTYTGSLVARSRRFVLGGESITDEIVFVLLFVIVQIVGVTAIIATISTKLLIGFVLWMAIFIGSIFAFLKKRTELDEKSATQESKVTGVFSDIVSNVLNVKIFGTANREKSYYHKSVQSLKESQKDAWNFANWQNVLQRVFILILQGGVALYCYRLWMHKEITAGTFYLVLTYGMSVSAILWQFGRTIRRISRSIVDSKEMVEIIDRKSDIVDMPTALSNGSIQTKKRPAIAFRNVSFKYPNGSIVFKNLSLAIAPGQSVGIVGTSGAGKTTLTGLLLRFIEPQEGSIYIGEYDITRDLTREKLTEFIAYVPQTIDLFHRTIRENIAYAKTDATEAEIIAAAQKALVHDHIMSLKKGYETEVGERGVKISGGQRQRLAIARAILAKKPILVLDEATSSLDTITESEIQKILDEEFKDMTVIVIAHRLSTIRNVDRIIVLGDGGIIEDGTHRELIEKGGHYFKLLQEQQMDDEISAHDDESPKEQLNREHY